MLEGSRGRSLDHMPTTAENHWRRSPKRSERSSTETLALAYPGGAGLKQKTHNMKNTVHVCDFVKISEIYRPKYKLIMTESSEAATHLAKTKIK